MSRIALLYTDRRDSYEVQLPPDVLESNRLRGTQADGALSAYLGEERTCIYTHGGWRRAWFSGYDLQKSGVVVVVLTSLARRRPLS